MLPSPATLICLMGPTASGKTQLALELVQRLPCDIGTAKPTAEELALAPHRLIDIADPAQPYSAGQFCQDATLAIEEILAKKRIPLLVGGTMLYFRALQQGLSPLPAANPLIREKLSKTAEKIGWAALHQHLAAMDPEAGQRINARDAQRIQRALEIYQLTGLTPTAFYQQQKMQAAPYRMLNLGLMFEDRLESSQRIDWRFKHMLAKGFIEEVQNLIARGDLNKDMPSMCAVGYRQAWD
jgi:tRNA dimethylallyltransferase